MRRRRRHSACWVAAESSTRVLLVLALAVCWLTVASGDAAVAQTQAARPGARVDEDTIRVAALASKLEQWFICHRLNELAQYTLLQTQQQQQQQQQQHNQEQQQQQAQHNQQQQPNQQVRQADCAAHFDGHLCWPAARANETVRVACPQINWLPWQSTRHWPAAVDNNATLHPPNTTVIAAAAGLVMSPSSADAAYDAAAATTTTTLLDAAAHHSSSAAEQPTTPISHASKAAASYASRKCEPMRWQQNADYSQCIQDAPDKSADPTDRWIKLAPLDTTIGPHVDGNDNDDISNAAAPASDVDRGLFGALTGELERIEGAIDPYADPDLLEQWTMCIGNIMHHRRRASAGANSSDGSLQTSTSAAAPHRSCPIIFDGWRCWPATRAGDTAYVGCPRNQPGFSAERNAHKICTLDGTWYKHPLTNKYWSNYTTCVDTVDLAFRTKILSLYVIGNLISLVALTVSLIIFVSFKSLNCTRVTIHKNLFMSFIANNFMWIIWYTYVVNDAYLLQSNPFGCQLWHVVLHYFLVSNYFWMFCEGLYLHTLLVVAFVSEDKILKWFYLLGWLTPLPITLAYAYNRSYDDYYTNFCWMEESPYNLILMMPIGISLLLNLVFLINIVRVLVTKLRANNSPDAHQTRKAVRATLILIPLLGLHYILTPFRPEAKSEWEAVYEIMTAVCTSFQGLCVAMLFCFCNGEVIGVVRKRLKDTWATRSRRGAGHRARSNTIVSTAPAGGSSSPATTGCGGGGGGNSTPAIVYAASVTHKLQQLATNVISPSITPHKSSLSAASTTTQRQQQQQHQALLWSQRTSDASASQQSEPSSVFTRGSQSTDNVYQLGSSNNNNNNDSSSDKFGAAKKVQPLLNGKAPSLSDSRGAALRINVGAAATTSFTLA